MSTATERKPQELKPIVEGRTTKALGCTSHHKLPLGLNLELQDKILALLGFSLSGSIPFYPVLNAGDGMLNLGHLCDQCFSFFYFSQRLTAVFSFGLRGDLGVGLLNNVITAKMLVILRDRLSVLGI